MEFPTSITNEALLRLRQKVGAVSSEVIACVLNRYFGKDKVMGIAVMGPGRQKLDRGWKVEKLLCIIKINHIPCDRKRVQPGTLVHVPYTYEDNLC